MHANQSIKQLVIVMFSLQLILDHIRGWMIHYWYDGDEGWVSDPPKEEAKKIYYHAPDYDKK